MPKIWLLVGLGNIGFEFLETRHNTGFAFLDNLLPPKTVWKIASNYHFIATTLVGQKIIAIKPTTLMNLSGNAVKQALQDFALTVENLIVINDNVDLPLGKVKFKNSLSPSSHKGLKHLADTLKTQTIKTIHVGIDKQQPLHKWVLAKFTSLELTKLSTLFQQIKTQLHYFWQNPKIPFPYQIQNGKSAIHQSKVRKLVVVGGQFGDEGKGKVVDYYAGNFDIIARFAGGDNAGHTVKVGAQVFKFSILPVAMIRPTKISFLGAGCLINLEQLCQELTQLKKLVPQVGQLKIAARAHLILPYHLLIDRLQETDRKATLIGTTKRGIGPCVSDKVNRIGIQVADLLNWNNLTTKLARNLTLKNHLFQQPLKLAPLLKQLANYFKIIQPFIVDSVQFWDKNSTKSVLFEGAQGTLLDLQYGIYPFVTSTSPITWQAGLGTVANIQKAQFLGVFKAYISRVGTGPLPTNILDPTINESIVQTGNEYGVVTKRRRRIGWFDAVLANYAIKVNHFHQICLTLLDVLSVCDQIKICTHYQIGDQTYHLPPTDPSLWSQIKPQYITLSGWNQTDFSKITIYQQLPLNARLYIEKLEQILHIRISLISIGKNRHATIIR